MVPTPLVVLLLGTYGLYRWFYRREGGAAYWLIAAGISVAITLIRVGCVSAGLFLLQRPSSWLQIPAGIMAYLGLPEASLMHRRMENTVEYLTQLGAVVLAGSAIWIFAVAAVAALARHRRSGRSLG